MSAKGGTCWVFHAGALGDFVLTWPLLRALVASEREVRAVAPAEKARLARRVLGPGVQGVDGEQRAFARLWTGEAPEARDVDRSTDLVVSFIADEGSPWALAAAAMFPGARVLCAGAPGSASRAAVWRELEVAEHACPPARANGGGPIVLHIGAGGEAKRWPMACWLEIARNMRERGGVVRLIAGEVEAERLPREERAAFFGAGGEFLGSLDALADALEPARLFIGADSGPGHLAAQLGIATLALFGPTDPAIWSPVGPRARVLAPPEPAPMSWLAPGRVLDMAAALLT